jgi:hypothetical protein
VFEGYGVGLTVTELGVDSGPAEPGARRARLSEVLPVAAWSDGEKALELTRIQQARAMLDAYEAAVVVGFAADRPEVADPQPGRRGASTHRGARSPIPGTSEFFVDELALVTNSSPRTAGRLAERSWVLVERLPAVWAALADGELDTARARVFVEVLGSTAAGVPEAVVPLVMPEAAGLSLGRLRARLQKAVLTVDEAFAEHLRAAAEARAGVPDGGRDERAGGGAAESGGGGVLVDDRRAGVDAEARRGSAADRAVARAHPRRPDPAALG